MLEALGLFRRWVATVVSHGKMTVCSSVVGFLGVILLRNGGRMPNNIGNVKWMNTLLDQYGDDIRTKSMPSTVLPIGCSTNSSTPLEDVRKIVPPIITSGPIGTRRTVPNITVGILLLVLSSLLLGGGCGIELLCFRVTVLKIIDDNLECIQH
jgi:hypothetical protein